MEFKEYKEAMQRHFEEMTRDKEVLFKVDYDGDQLWETFLSAFPPGTNEVFRERREFDCSCCRHFVKEFGGVVIIDNGEVNTIWNFNPEDQKYLQVNDIMDEDVRNRPIAGVYYTKDKKHGTDKNHEMMPAPDGEAVHTWHHFFIELPEKFIYRGRETLGTIAGQIRADKEVLLRGLEDISLEAIDTVLELCHQKSLYKGEEWISQLQAFHDLHIKYHNLHPHPAIRDHFCWEQSVKTSSVICRMKNHSIGVLLEAVSHGVDLDAAVSQYERVTAPTNYKRPKAIFTKKMIEQAKDTIENLGLTNSLPRRFACLGDITVANTLFANRDALKQMKDDPFSKLEAKATSKAKTFSNVKELPIADFVENILPTARSLEVFFENQHSGNLVSLIAPEYPDAPPLFKWDNNFSWAYNGNIADSMKQRVKELGGSVEGCLRFTIQWNDEDVWNKCDYDAHCKEPNGNLIYYQNKASRHVSSGMLDVDIISPVKGQSAVENIIYNNLSKMPDGEYKFIVHCFSASSGNSGFCSEIETADGIFSFDYRVGLNQDQKVHVASVLKEGDRLSVIPKLKHQETVRNYWGISTNQFHPVAAMTYSPNYWNSKTGHRHYFFFIPGCINPDQPNGFFNEFLPESLMKHKRVFAALGSQMAVQPSNQQISGLGFSATKDNSLVCKVTGAIERVTKLLF